MGFKETIKQSSKNRLFWSIYVDLQHDQLIPTSEGGVCDHFHNLLLNVGKYSLFLDLYLKDFVIAQYREDVKNVLQPQNILTHIKAGQFCSIDYVIVTSHGNLRQMTLRITSPDGDLSSDKCIITAMSIDDTYNILTVQNQDRNINLQNTILNNLEHMFYAIACINLEHNTYQEVMSGPGIHSIIQNVNSAQEALNRCADVLILDIDRERVREFFDLSTLRSRIDESDSISTYYCSVGRRWMRDTFIQIDKNEVLLITQDIGEEKDTVLKHEYVLKNALDHAVKLAETDDLTTLLNRRSGERYITQFLDSQYSGMFCLIDIDDFKLINDTYGHDVGDQVLQAVGQSLKEIFRNDDVLIRIGGDEFVIFVAGLRNRDDGNQKIEIFKHHLSEKVSHLFNDDVTVSVGTVYSDDFDDKKYNVLYKAADKLMYQEKETKKNK